MIKKILVVSLLVMLSACSSLQKELKNYVQQPEVNYKSIAVGKVSMDGIELNPTVNIANNNSFSIPINAVTYNLSLNNKQMLAGQSEEIGTLPAKANKDVTLSLNLSKESLSSLQQLLFEEKKLDYQVKGSVKTMGLAIPFEKSATLYAPEISIRDIKVVNASFSQLDILLSVDVDNQNNFSLPLETLSYSVSSNNKALFNGDIKNNKIAEGKNNLQLPLSIKPNDLFSSVFGLLASPKLPLHFEVKSPLFTKSHEQSLDLSAFF
ncbi:MAG TPA: LEA type 2 family protein [Psychromonas sp.]